MDVLTDLLERSRARGAAFSSTTAHGTWGLTFPGSAPLSVHALVQGEAHLWSADHDEALHVFPGDVVLIREHTPHHLASQAGAPCVPLVEAMATVSGVGRRLEVGDPGEPVAATFFCGAYRFEGDLCQSLLQALPEMLPLRPAAGSTLRATMDLLAGEMLRDDPGQQTLLDRLLDVALVQILREHFTTAAATAPGWFRASGDARIAPALQALHANPGRQWTVAELAEHALLSRSAFARQFTELLGVPPLAYLNDWRMALARERLRDSDARLASIGATLGYASEFSFAAAFKRHHGTAPGRWRREASITT
ncbi:MAG TPA: AraC family transcriptional regulator [Solirubrobacteraceae bacterium]|jgi:AraC-like DNA-binding protein|nr:AraC family transcriptional regulator [Solirubrobacteraceae bacterium]